MRAYAPISDQDEVKLVPPVGVEPTLLAELDFESSASTNSATGATRRLLAEPYASRNYINSVELASGS